MGYIHIQCLYNVHTITPVPNMHFKHYAIQLTSCKCQQEKQGYHNDRNNCTIHRGYRWTCTCTDMVSRKINEGHHQSQDKT